MKLKYLLFAALVLAAVNISICAQGPARTYQQMSRVERSQFVADNREQDNRTDKATAL